MTSARTIAVALAVLAALATAATAQTLRIAPHSDLKVVDPIWTSALISVDHGYMIYDTLFALDDELAVQPQMVERYETSADKLTWSFTLRDGLEWHDGQPVTAEDCVASLKRWAARDSMGQKLMSYVADLAAPDAKTIRMVDILDPVATGFLNASCDKAMFGWPCDAELERLRDAFAKETDAGRQKAIAEAVQLRAAAYPTHIPLGQYVQPVAMRKNVTGLLTGPSIAYWNIEVR